MEITNSTGVDIVRPNFSRESQPVGQEGDERSKVRPESAITDTVKEEGKGSRIDTYV